MCDHEEKPSAAVVETLVAHHRELLRFVEKRVGSREVAEEIGERPGIKQMGRVMKVATAIAAGKADGARISAFVKERL